VANEAARLAEALRAGKKQQGLTGAQIAEQIERLTGSRPSPMWVSRRLHGSTGRVPLVPVSAPCQHCGEVAIRLDPQLEAMTHVLGVDPDAVLAGSVEGAEPAETPEESAALVDMNLRRMGSAGIAP
jgi:transcriptional regulator with XRE-family HTH domain